MLRVLAVLFAVASAGCMIFAIAGMVSGHQSERTGWRLRAGALLCFAIAVALNVVAH